MSVKAVVFDIGGVLEINPRTGWRERWAGRLQLDPDEFDRRVGGAWAGGDVGAATLREIESRTAAALGLDRATLAALMDDAWTEYVGTLNVELADYFVGLRSRYRSGMLSNSFVGAREREQEAYGFGGMCDVIVYSHEAGCLKPDPQIYQLTCEHLAVGPDEVVFLDDVQAYADGARAVGMRAVTFVDNRQAIADVEAELTR